MIQTMRTKRTSSLINDGLVLVDTKYGPHSSNYLAYHNAEHTCDVIEAAEKIGLAAFNNSKITELDVELLILAACYHDAEHGMHGSNNEYESIRIVTEKMKGTGEFTEQEISKVAELIKATIVVSSKKGIVQSATNDYATQILADADLNAFGKPYEVYWDRSKKYYEERVGASFDSADASEQRHFIDGQINVLQTHKYYTKEAETVYPNTSSNVTKLIEQKG